MLSIAEPISKTKQANMPAKVPYPMDHHIHSPPLLWYNISMILSIGIANL